MFELSEVNFHMLEIIQHKISIYHSKTKSSKIKIGINKEDYPGFGIDITETQLLESLSILYQNGIIGKFELNEDGVYKDTTGKFTHWSEDPYNYPGDYTFDVKLKKFNKMYHDEKIIYNTIQSKRKIKILYSRVKGSLSNYDKTKQLYNKRTSALIIDHLLNSKRPAPSVDLRFLTGIKTISSLSKVINKFNKDFMESMGLGEKLIINVPGGYIINYDIYKVVFLDQ